MKQRIILFLNVFLFFIAFFLIQKVLFLVSQLTSYSPYTFSDYASVIWHGLPLDISMTGYLAIVPILLLIASIWVHKGLIKKIFNIYFAIIIVLLLIITVADIILYPHWGFHFDATIFFYLQNPKEAMASGTTTEMVASVVVVALFSVQIYRLYYVLIGRQISKLKKPKSVPKTCLVLVLLVAFLFLPIRGGISVSTMNVGKVYFSNHMFLNHAAINPVFNLMSSLGKSEDFAAHYQFYDKEEATKTFNALHHVDRTDSIPQLLNTTNPNIMLIIVESYSSIVTTDSIIAPNMCQLAKEGINFTNFYANSFRTDRGIISIMSGYPAHPTVAIMKYPQKSQSLPSIPHSLKTEGYQTSFYYGGDADFTNMRSYLKGAGAIDNLIDDTDFPLSDRLTKWGVPDNLLLQKAYADIEKGICEEPFMQSILTLSSHEPFDVPTCKFEMPFHNSVHFTDSCLGQFISQLKTDPIWNNTLIILTADHCMGSYPAGTENNEAVRFHIPMIWLGGAVKQPLQVDTFASQNDIAATLFSQLGIKHTAFTFSKDIFNPYTQTFAFYSFMDGFSMISADGLVVYDNETRKPLRQQGDNTMEEKAKSYFQQMYLDLGAR